jgi:hypothetical protein
MRSWYYEYAGQVYRVPCPTYHAAACAIVQAFGAFVVGNMRREAPDGADVLELPGVIYGIVDLFSLRC